VPLPLPIMRHELHFDPYEKDWDKVYHVLEKEYGTIDPEQFLELVRHGQVPPRAPHGCSPFGHDFLPFEMSMAGYHLKDKLRQLGMFAVVDQYWTRQLADWIGTRKCLEIMAGWGWLSKALSEHGVDIIATDDYSWNNYETIKQVHPIEKLEACAAIQEHPNAEVLLCSWPYMDNDFTTACKAWGSQRPIIYIGEGYGGCTADDEFHDGFVELEPSVKIDILAWSGIHDHVQIGHWEKSSE